MAKKHWTQTRAGKKKLSASIKSFHARRRSLTVTPKEEKHDATIPTETLAYALGFTECFIQTFAGRTAVPARTLAAQLGAALSSAS